MSGSEILNEYEKFAPYYDTVADKRNHFASQLGLLLEVFGTIEPITNVLDASCATGKVICSLASEYKQFRYYGSDFCPAFIKKAASQKSCNVEFRLCDWESISLTFKKINFGFIYILGNSLFHCKNVLDLKKILNIIYSKLSEGGYFFFDYRDWAENIKLERYNGLNANKSIMLEKELMYETSYRFKANKHFLEHIVYKKNSTKIITKITLGFLNISDLELLSILEGVGFKVQKQMHTSDLYPFKTILLKKCS